MKKYFVLIVSLMFSLCASVHGESVNFAEEIIGIHSAGKLKLKGSIEYYDNINFDATKINENGILKISFYPKDERNRFEIKTHVKHGEFAA
jgi:hypothetical protein